ncbi:hypothetical protein HY249_01720 [Candidatus Azambacteria bacterium]|nr:hypothetical protein [Candidatus Azambacteria bacterium]
MAKLNAQATQQLVDIESIRDGVVILKSGALRAILMCSSVNLALKSQDEQDALIYQYQNFINGLDFSMEFVVHSRKLDITDYIAEVKTHLEGQKNELLRIQTEEYMEFIQSFVGMQNIMAKSFYAIVPFSLTEDTKKGFIEKIFSPKTESFVKMSGEEFTKYKNQLWQRVENVIAGLRTVGVRSEPLNDAELKELFFSIYNPGETGKEALK